MYDVVTQNQTIPGPEMKNCLFAQREFHFTLPKNVIVYLTRSVRNGTTQKTRFWFTL